MLITTSLLALLSVLGSGTTAVVNGRQRTVATSLGRQALERLQGSAYADVAMNLASPGLASDPRVTGTAPALAFEGEQLVGGSGAPYRATSTVAGTTYATSTFITAVGLNRRLTVFVDWTPSLSGSFHTQRFSTLLYPLGYGSYPAGSGLAEVVGATVSVTGSLGGDLFEEARVSLPTARSRTSASTLRTAQGTASGTTAFLDLAAAFPSQVTSCVLSGSPTFSAQCPLGTVNEAADNDSGTAAPAWSGADGSLFGGATVLTAGGATWSLPAGVGSAHAAVAACGGCGFGDGDGLPWADATRQTTTAAEATFADSDGHLVGRLWALGLGWLATTSVDHDSGAGDRVTATAQLTVPATKVFSLTGAGGGFDAAVRVGSFTATATAAAGDGTVDPTVSASQVQVDLWDGAAYRSVPFTPGTSLPETATAVLNFSDASGAHTVTLTSRVESSPRTSTSTGANPRAEAHAQQPSLLLVTVDVTISGPHPGAMTITFDYGQVTARSTWTVAA